MTYKEKLQAYRDGTLGDEESREIQQDIEKFNALLDYIDEENMNSVEDITLDENSTTISEYINKAINRRINKSTANIFITVFLLLFIFIFGLFGELIAAELEWSSLTIHIMKNIYSVIYCIVIFYMLHRSFAYKEKAPAIFLIVWTVGLVLLSIISLTVSDAAPFFIVLFNALTPLSGEILYLFNLSCADDISFILGAIAAAAVLILSIAALVMAKKPKEIKPISKRNARTICIVFVAVSVLASASASVLRLINGEFEDTYIGNQIAQDAASELQDFYIENPTEQSYDELMQKLKELGYEEKFSGVIRKRTNDINAQFEIYKDENGNIESITESFIFQYRYPYVPIHALETIDSKLAVGSDEEEVMRQLHTLGILPGTVYINNYDGVYTKECLFVIDVKENDSYPNGYDEHIEVRFKDGKLAAFRLWSDYYKNFERYEAFDKAEHN